MTSRARGIQAFLEENDGNNVEEKRTFSDDEVLSLWPQAERELRSLERILEKSGGGLTASQLGLVLQMAHERYDLLVSSRKELARMG